MNSLIKFSTKLQNAVSFKKLYVFFYSSCLIKKILYLFLLKGWILGFTLNKNTYKVYLKYFEKSSILIKLIPVSTLLKKRKYFHNFFFKHNKILQTSTIYLVSCNKGVFLSSDMSFLNLQVGGEILLKIKTIY